VRYVVDVAMILELIARNGLVQLGMSNAIYGGDCPFCGHTRCFTLWATKGEFRCFHCGADGKFVRTPERTAELKAAEVVKKLAFKQAMQT
jgi:uncharacterized protein (DUF983 family)